MSRPMPRLVLPLLLLLAPLLLADACPGDEHEARGWQLFASPQTEPIALDAAGGRLYVANTTSNTVSVIDTGSAAVVAEVEVGVEPVSVEVRPPSGLEVWVANHVSDSVSVIDTDPASVTYLQVIETVQQINADGSTAFDEPADIAFTTDGAKAYVSLSSRNQVAVVDANAYAVTGSIAISAQDPRALEVVGNRLYVLPFESGNQSEMSICATPNGTAQCTLGVLDVVGNAGTNPNLIGRPKNIVLDPQQPDRDLFVFSTVDESPVGSPIEHLGTLLYGLAATPGGDVYVTNTDARNHDQDGNGLAAPPPEGLGLGLDDLDNRLFRNRITHVDCTGSACTAPLAADYWELEPFPANPAPGEQLATPYGVAVSDAGDLLLVTAAGSHRIATVSTASGQVADRLDIEHAPRGVVLRSGSGGQPHTAYVLATLDNTVRVVSIDPVTFAMTPGATIAVGNDPTPENVRLGRIAFNDANASTTGTFSCGSCHPDAHVDQLMWVIGATCDDPGCDQEEPRSTMPIRGLRETLPLHWDGTLGDPIGGINGAVGTNGPAVPANCDPLDPHSCFRQLTNESLGAVMCDRDASGTCAPGPSGLPGALDAATRDRLADFLASVSYPPARSRSVDDAVSPSGIGGFADFFMDQGAGNAATQTCADNTGGCHELPLGVVTNSPTVGGFEAPTMRGMTDRFLQFSGGFLFPEEVMTLAASQAPAFGIIPWDPARGYDELEVFSAAFFIFNPAYNVFPDDIFQMFEEASTGHSGAFARQVTVNPRIANDPVLRAEADALLRELEAADENGFVNLYARGMRGNQPLLLNYRSLSQRYKNDTLSLGHDRIFAEAAANIVQTMTFTAYLRRHVGESAHPQPLISTVGTGTGPTGDPDLPVLPGDNPMTLTAVDVRSDASIVVDGIPVGGTISCLGGSFAPTCSSETISVTLDAVPAPDGTHLLQIQDYQGLISNELPICVGAVLGCL